MEDWEAELRQGRPEPAWDRFLHRYRRLIFAAIRHYADDYDDVMDIFAHVSATLREDDMARLRARIEEPNPRAKFSTWLVAVVRHRTVDWFRHRDGRRRLPSAVAELPPLQRRIFELVFLDRRSHVEAFELIRARDAPTLSFPGFLADLRATYKAVSTGRRGQVLRDLARVPPPPLADSAALSDLEHAERRALLTRALDALDPEDRLAVQLYVVEELEAEQVARILRLPNAKAVYNRVYRTLAVLRERLEKSGIRKGDL
jgi:DNA-directed RNA polymerase specialized sigma24 family protein